MNQVMLSSIPGNWCASTAPNISEQPDHKPWQPCLHCHNHLAHIKKRSGTRTQLDTSAAAKYTRSQFYLDKLQEGAIRARDVDIHKKNMYQNVRWSYKVTDAYDFDTICARSWASDQPCLPFLVCPSFLQLLSQRWASYLPVHLCLLQWIKHTQTLVMRYKQYKKGGEMNQVVWSKTKE